MSISDKVKKNPIRGLMSQTRHAGRSSEIQPSRWRAPVRPPKDSFSLGGLVRHDVTGVRQQWQRHRARSFRCRQVASTWNPCNNRDQNVSWRNRFQIKYSLRIRRSRDRSVRQLWHRELRPTRMQRSPGVSISGWLLCQTRIYLALKFFIQLYKNWLFWVDFNQSRYQFKSDRETVAE